MTRVGSWRDVDSRFYGVLVDFSLFFRLVFNLLPRRKRQLGTTRRETITLVQILGLVFSSNIWQIHTGRKLRDLEKLGLLLHALLLHHRMFTPRFFFFSEQLQYCETT